MLTLPDTFRIEVKMTEVRTEPVTIVSESEKFVHQEEESSRKWPLYFFKMELNEDTPITDVDKAYAERGLRPLPEHLLDLFIKLYPTFAKGHNIGTQHPASDCQPDIKTTAFRFVGWGGCVRYIKQGEWVPYPVACSESGTDLNGYSKCTIWFVGLSN